MYAARYNRTPVEKVTDPLIPNKIDALLAMPDLNDWEKNFLTSIKDSFTKYQGLTKGQHDAFLNVEKKHDASAIAARDEWRKSWDAQKKATWDLMIDYYSKTPYTRVPWIRCESIPTIFQVRRNMRQSVKTSML